MSRGTRRKSGGTGSQDSSAIRSDKFFGPSAHSGPSADSAHLADDTSEANPALAIGTLLKSLRAEAKLSLDQLAKRSRVSRGMLSQIELGRSVPTITVLSRISAAFELPAAVFLSTEETGRATLMKREVANLLRSADGKFVSRALFPFTGARRNEFYELTLHPGCRYSSAAHRAGTTENLVVASGSIQVEILGVTHSLASGDALQFVADAPHGYSNPASETAVAYLVMAYVQPVSY
jgi:transcriptional regulator with XRE-family HTH domain